MNYTLIGLNVIAFLFEVSMGKQLGNFLQRVAVIPAEYWGALRGHEVDVFKLLIAPFASMFLHGGWGHLLGNMWFLFLFGDNVEDRMGHARYLFFYLLCGLGATAAHIAASANSIVPAIGASGAISGVLAAYLVLFPFARILSLLPLGYFSQIIELPALIFIGLWFIIQLFSGLVELGAILTMPQKGGVAWFAHIGGFGAGLLLHRFFCWQRARRVREPSSFWR